MIRSLRVLLKEGHLHYSHDDDRCESAAVRYGYNTVGVLRLTSSDFEQCHQYCEGCDGRLARSPQP